MKIIKIVLILGVVFLSNSLVDAEQINKKFEVNICYYDFLSCDKPFDVSKNSSKVSSASKSYTFKSKHFESSYIIAIILIVVLGCLSYLVFFDKDRIVIEARS